jgi:PLP-dependent transaminase
MMLGVELHDDASSVQAGARADGVIVRASGTSIVLSPPLVMTDGQADRLVRVLDAHVRACGKS